jgi:phospholipid/cholesterol/gamma-HCH transport system permease protein
LRQHPPSSLEVISMSPPRQWLHSQASGRATAVDAARIEWSEDRRTVRLIGSWITTALADIGQLPAGPGPAAESVTVDGGGLTGLDTAGALLIQRLLEGLRGEGWAVRLKGLDDRRAALLDLVAERVGTLAEVLAGPPPGQPSGLERLGRLVVTGAREGFTMLSFGGETALAFFRGLPHPGRFRWRQALLVIELDGVHAMPVLGMLSFLLGVVIAYQSGVQLRLYGGNLYVVDLVTITVLRELGPLMTAIVVAGRSGSAYTAQIGTMQVTEEIDALRSIGVAPQDLLVLPKVFGLVIALPLLTVFSDLAAVAGGLVMSALMLDLSPETFLRRIPEAVSINSLMTGLAKAPVFAAVIAVVGCYQGFQVRGGADSVGRNTTTSVVQAIVLVIVIDAGFSVIYSWLGI